MIHYLSLVVQYPSNNNTSLQMYLWFTYHSNSYNTSKYRTDNTNTNYGDNGESM